METIVCIRHGEKPHGGLGQLTNRGLNRSLALPEVLLKKYGTPQFIFAPNPSEKVDGAKYFYIRPLATIEPTAIRCGLPVNTEFGYLEIEGWKTNWPARSIKMPPSSSRGNMVCWTNSAKTWSGTMAAT